MGIKGLTKFISDNAPRAIKEAEAGTFMGQALAIDASMSLYQFMVAIREGEGFQNLVNEAGETTSHISGMLSRVVRLMENGIKPVYVFDGKPPALKSGELAVRRDRKEQAEKDLADAQEVGDKDEIKKYMSRTVKVTKQHNDEVKRLLRLVGVPVVEAPCEAEAQCAILCKASKVYAVATEDADALTFGTSILVRNLNFSENKAKTNPILTINLPIALEDLGLSMDQFIDFCILCGCDYTDTIRGIGPCTAYNLIKEHQSIEKILETLDKGKHPVPDNFPFSEARRFFKDPEVTEASSIELVWKDPDVEALKSYLIDEMTFSETRVDSYINRLKKAKGKTSQMRLESFFGSGSTSSSKVTKPVAKIKGKGKAKGKAKGLSVVGGTNTTAAGKRKKPSSSYSSSPMMEEPGRKVKKEEEKSSPGTKSEGADDDDAVEKEPNTASTYCEDDGENEETYSGGEVKKAKREVKNEKNREWARLHTGGDDEELDL